MCQLKDYVVTFIHTYREHVNRLQEKEKEFFGEYVGEQILRKPVQVEVMEFDNPYRMIWFFLFDRTKPDLMISVHKLKWQDLSVLIAEFGAKYSELQLDLRHMYRILEHSRNMNIDNLNYSIDVFKNAYFLCFPANPRLDVWPLSRILEGDSSPQTVAEAILRAREAWSWGKDIGSNIRIYAFEEGKCEDVTSNYER